MAPVARQAVVQIRKMSYLLRMDVLSLMGGAKNYVRIVVGMDDGRDGC
jgi:hypothetical protein